MVVVGGLGRELGILKNSWMRGREWVEGEESEQGICCVFLGMRRLESCFSTGHQ